MRDSADCCDMSGVHWALECSVDDDIHPGNAHIQGTLIKEQSMFIAMNRFRVKKGSEADFEAVWLEREILINKEPGFVSFHLLRGPENEDHTLYASHTVWQSEDAFKDWTRSQSFRDAHRNAGQNAPLYLGGPSFEGFAVIQTVV